jgi:type IV pilus assembly protein PilQ
MKNATFEKLFIFMIALILAMGCVTAHAGKQASHTAGPSAITSVQIVDNTLIIKGDQPFTYALHKATDPYRATLEIPDMTIGQYAGRISSDRAGITEIISHQIESPRLLTKLDIVLQNPSSLSPEYRDNTLTIAIKRDDPVVLAELKEIEASQKAAVRLALHESTAEKLQPRTESAPTISKATEINNIEIKKSADTVRVLITGNGAMIPNVFPINERIVVDIPNTTLRAAVPSHTFSPLKSIRAGKHKDKLRLVLDLKEKTTFDVTAVGNTVEISLVSKETAALLQASLNTTKETASALSPPQGQKISSSNESLIEGVYTGKKISLDFQDADVVPIFRLLGDISGYNMVVNPDVKGKVTLKLINVPWDQALDIILRTLSLSKIVEGNIIRIVPTGVVAKELDDISRAKKAAAEAGELRTKIFPVNYAELSKLKDAIDKAKLLSSRGSISLDERGSSIIVNDLDVNLERIDSLIKEIDLEVMQARQVMIEAKIVEVNTDYLKELGISWAARWTIPNSTTLNSIIDFPAAAAEGAGGLFGFGYVPAAGNFLLNMQLTAIENTNNGRVLSNPRIMTMNNQEAKITQGRTIYVPAATSDKIEFKAIDALLSLTVKPRIAPGGAIFMDLDITKDEPGAPTAGGVDILKNTVKTSVLVNDSDTVVIGGVFKKSEINRTDGIPGLSKLPLVGLLFKRDRDQSTTSEVLVFITPKIVNFADLK